MEKTNKNAFHRTGTWNFSIHKKWRQQKYKKHFVFIRSHGWNHIYLGIQKRAAKENKVLKEFYNLILIAFIETTTENVGNRLY